MPSRKSLQENIEARVKTLYGEEVPAIDITRNKYIGEDPTSKRISFPHEATSPLTITGAPAPLADVSSNKNGTCIIRPSYLTLLHNHAGSHADQPLHIGMEYEGVHFNQRQYTGNATIIDLSSTFQPNLPRTINRNILESSIEMLNSNQKRRLLFRTQRDYTDEWDANGAHFDRHAAEYLAGLKELVLVGIDSASVDHPNEDTHKGAHLPLIGNGIAVLEGLQFRLFYPSHPHDSEKGVLQTIMSPHQKGEDAIGVIPYFNAIRSPNISQSQ